MKWTVRLLIAAAVIAGLALLGFNLFRGQIAQSAFERNVAERIGTDPTAGLEDGLHVYLCGTGSPMPDPTRAGPCIGVLAGERAFVVDAGSGSIRNLAQMGFPLGRTERVYLTHLHSDHIDGLGELLLQAWIGGNRAAPLPIAGPSGVAKVVAGFNQVYQIDSTYRVAHHGVEIANPQGFGGTPETIELPAGPGGRQVVLSEGDLTVTAFAVDHAPVEPAFGFRIDYKDRSVTISGDTVYHPNLVGVAEGTDLLLHEALDPEMVQTMADAAGANGAASLQKIFRDILDYHASPEDAARAAAEAEAGVLVLYHIVPPLPSPLLNSVFLGDSADAYAGEIIVGQDGMVFSLPAGSDTMTERKALN